jgi:RNA polymerase sigma-70 factor, ECF subfamily
MPTRGSLAKLINGCSHGDRRAFEILYQQSPPELYGICPSLRKKEDLAEDLLQELFTKMWRRSGRFGSFKGTAMSWMTRIVRNRTLNSLRSAYI